MRDHRRTLVGDVALRTARAHASYTSDLFIGEGEFEYGPWQKVTAECVIHHNDASLALR
jgi:hypothetical protein